MSALQLQGIKNIIIDMGGVILDIDYNRTVQAFSELGIPDFDRYFTQAKQSGFVEDFEKGSISPNDFRDQIRKITQINFSDAEIDHAWDALILEPSKSKLLALKQLAERYNLFLLSNNNAIHYQKCISTIEQIMPFEAFSSLFKKNYYSHLIQLRKPDQAVFEFVLKENNLRLSDTIFFDDSLQHLESAHNLGLKTLHISPELSIEKLI